MLAKASEVVIATDADREGEVIARELLDYLNYSGPVARLWLSALDEESVRKALTQLKRDEETQPLYQAGLARSRADWLLGMNLTRLCTVMGRQLGYRNVLSVGRVQTPTLRLVVERDKAIANFVSKPFYEVEANVEHGIPFSMKWQVPDTHQDEQGRCLRQSVADEVVQSCQGQQAVVTHCETKRVKANPPPLFFLGSLQKAMSSKYGYSAKSVLDGAQALYEKHKLTSYPRTDCAYLPLSQQGEVAAILAKLGTATEFSTWVTQTSPELKSPCWNDKKVAQSSHHAIIPTATTPNLSGLSELERHLYQAIVQRYLGQFFTPAEDDATLLEVSCQAHRFKTKGKIERVKGWRVVVEGEKEKEAPALPELAEGEVLTLSTLTMKPKKTTPPAHYTEGTLLEAMANIAKSEHVPENFKAILKETAGLGTQATRADVIENLKSRGFIEAKGKSLLSAESGRHFIAALPQEISSPVMTALWEQGMDSIEQGEMTLDSFMAQQTQFVTTLVGKMKSGELPLTLPKIEQPTMPCPVCQKTMRLIQGKSTFWACEDKDQCGLILDHVRGKVAKHQSCQCGKG
ncbi:DNA topoisomerase 3, partial [Vibrio sp. 10N.261.46.A3]|uniref:DNA topoisomerase 3 n=1 Tax=Vibrio sp. 10N.261.46.A3 TaxID=3229658 RepID=UPI00354AD7B6